MDRSELKAIGYLADAEDALATAISRVRAAEELEQDPAHKAPLLSLIEHLSSQKGRVARAKRRLHRAMERFELQ